MQFCLVEGSFLHFLHLHYNNQNSNKLNIQLILTMYVLKKVFALLQLCFGTVYLDVVMIAKHCFFSLIINTFFSRSPTIPVKTEQSTLSSESSISTLLLW